MPQPRIYYCRISSSSLLSGLNSVTVFPTVSPDLQKTACTELLNDGVPLNRTFCIALVHGGTSVLSYITQYIQSNAHTSPSFLIPSSPVCLGSSVILSRASWVAKAFSKFPRTTLAVSALSPWVSVRAKSFIIGKCLHINSLSSNFMFLPPQPRILKIQAHMYSLSAPLSLFGQGSMATLAGPPPDWALCWVFFTLVFGLVSEHVRQSWGGYVLSCEAQVNAPLQARERKAVSGSLPGRSGLLPQVQYPRFSDVSTQMSSSQVSVLLLSKVSDLSLADRTVLESNLLLSSVHLKVLALTLSIFHPPAAWDESLYTLSRRPSGFPYTAFNWWLITLSISRMHWLTPQPTSNSILFVITTSLELLWGPRHCPYRSIPSIPFQLSTSESFNDCYGLPVVIHAPCATGNRILHRQPASGWPSSKTSF